jgi:hypothetical protein
MIPFSMMGTMVRESESQASTLPSEDIVYCSLELAPGPLSATKDSSALFTPPLLLGKGRGPRHRWICIHRERR